MVFDSLDIACLRFSVQLEQRKKPGQHFMPIALLRHRPAGIGQRERPVFLVMKIPLIRQLCTILVTLGCPTPSDWAISATCAVPLLSSNS